MSSTNLFIHNIGYILNTVLIIFLVFLIFVKDIKPLANRLLVTGMFFTAVFTLSHVIGVNISDSNISRLVLMFNLSTFIFTALFAHAIILLIGKVKEQKIIITAIYILQLGLVTIFLFLPDAFILDSIPKLYFPNYYVAGNFYWIGDITNALIPLYFFYHMIRKYLVSDYIMKNRLKYLLIGFFLAYVFGYTATPLVTGHNVDPIWSIFFIPFFAIPFTYAVLKYELLDIRIIAKQAFLYFTLVVLVGSFIGLLNFLNNYILNTYAAFPVWVFPAVSSLLAVSIGYFVWIKLRETDLLKYEFITVVTHKFRTPLTQIKWSVENLLEAENNKIIVDSPIKKEEELKRIQSATFHLVELTGLLANISDTSSFKYKYENKPVEIQEIIVEIVDSVKEKAFLKDIKIESIDPNIKVSSITDRDRVKSIIQIIIDNAISYTPNNGKIKISLNKEKNKIIFKVQDNGIGIAKNEQSYVFSKFFRGKQAMRADTEGMGIGLFTAQQMINKLGGKIWVESEGENMGSIFYIQLPYVEK